MSPAIRGGVTRDVYLQWTPSGHVRPNLRADISPSNAGRFSQCLGTRAAGPRSGQTVTRREATSSPSK